MVFSDLIFLFFFLPAVLLVTKLSPRRIRNIELLLFSLLFYAWGEPIYVLLMLSVIIINYAAGLSIACFPVKTHAFERKLILVLAIIINLAILGYFKYTGFVLTSLNKLFGKNLSIPEILLPIGISFYIFQSMSYVIDVYRYHVRPQQNPLLFGTYVSLFPQLIAGPIVRYRDIADQLTEREETMARFSYGVKRFIYGLAKKVLIANQMGILTDRMLLNESGTISAWVGIAAYTLQIYFDFSGYSDMAIGLGRMMGFRFIENFAHPYVSRSITEFWRRWHISLSSWFKEYVYITLGGNRKGLARQCLIILFLRSSSDSRKTVSWQADFPAATFYTASSNVIYCCFRLGNILLHRYRTLAYIRRQTLCISDRFRRVPKICFGLYSRFSCCVSCVYNASEKNTKKTRFLFCPLSSYCVQQLLSVRAIIHSSISDFRKLK